MWTPHFFPPERAAEALLPPKTIIEESHNETAGLTNEPKAGDNVKAQKSTENRALFRAVSLSPCPSIHIVSRQCLIMVRATDGEPANLCEFC